MALKRVEENHKKLENDCTDTLYKHGVAESAHYEIHIRIVGI